MGRTLIVFVVVCLCLETVLPCAEGSFRVTEKGTRVWTAPGGGWEVLTRFMKRDMSEIARFLEGKPSDVDAARLYEVMVNEPGVWMGFSIKFVRVQRVVFTKSTKVVLIDREGKRYESEGCFFSPDLMQTQVYDSRKMNVVVSTKTVQRHPKHGLPMMDTKFRDGTFRLKDIVEFEVVGAIEDTVQRATQ